MKFFSKLFIFYIFIQLNSQTTKIYFKNENLIIEHVENFITLIDSKNQSIGNLEYTDYQNDFFIKNIEIIEHKRQKGYGSLLLQYTCIHFASLHAKRIWLIVAPYEAKLEDRQKEFNNLVKFYIKNNFDFQTQYNSVVMCYKPLQHKIISKL